MSNIQALITKTRDDIELIEQHKNQLMEQLHELESKHNYLVAQSHELAVRLHTLEEVAQIENSSALEAVEVNYNDVESLKTEEPINFGKLVESLEKELKQESTKPQTSEVRSASPTHHHVGHRKNRHK